MANFLVAILLFALPTWAQAQQNRQYETPNTGGAASWPPGSNDSSSEIDPAVHSIRATQTITGCGSPQFRSDNFTIVWGTLTLQPKLQLLRKPNGAWVPQSVTGNAITSAGLGQSTYVSSISASGRVTTVENGLYPPSPGSNNQSPVVYSIESLDLNTGQYTWHRVITEPWVETTSQGATCVASYTDTQDRTAMLPVTPLVPATAQYPILSFANPFSQYGLFLQAPALFPPEAVPSSPQALALSADGMSAAVVVIQSDSPAPATLTLSAPGLNCPCAGSSAFGSLAPYDPGYLSNPAPRGTTTLDVSDYIDNGDGTYTFLALLWAPPTIPVPTSGLQTLTFQSVLLNVSVTQVPYVPVQTSITLLPPPLLLVHGVWSSPAAWADFKGFLQENYPHQLIQTVDYSAWKAEDFGSSNVQTAFYNGLASALQNAAGQGVVARQVDVVGHSMGGLAARYFMNAASNPSFQGTQVPVNGFLPRNPVHTLITVGAPHEGSPLASTLEMNLMETPTYSTAGAAQIVQGICTGATIKSCTLEAVLSFLDKPAGSAVVSLKPGSRSLQALMDTNDYESVVGVAPPPSSTPPLFAGSGTEAMLDVLTLAFTNQTISDLLGPQNDTIVGYNSQQGPAPSAVGSINGVVHTALPFTGDTSETESPAVWNQIYCWLMTGSGAPGSCGASSSAAQERLSRAQSNQTGSSISLPQFDLTGYTLIDSSNVIFSPPSGTTLCINTTFCTNSPGSITATSSTKTISEVLLFQQVQDPTDAALLYAVQSPFKVPFVPSRMGGTSFVAFTLFSDMTYAQTLLSYTFQPYGTIEGLTLRDVPAGGLPLGSSTVVHAQVSNFNEDSLDVTGVATYRARSDGSSVFSVGNGGIITATGNGVDWLDVTYTGQSYGVGTVTMTASAQISIGTCTYALSPTNQIVDYGGGNVSVQVTTQSGCAWTADTGGSTWLTATSGSGSGSGTIKLMATGNTTGGPQTAFVTVANQDVAIIQPGTACYYYLSQTQVTIPGAGGSASIGVNTACPISAASSAPWLGATSLENSVSYSAGPNTSGISRMATLTIGTQSVSVTQPAVSTSVTNLLSSSLTVTAGQSLTLTATVVPQGSASTPTGSVNFLDANTLLGTATVSGTGAATFSTSTLAVGTHYITASYRGDTNFAGSDSSLLTIQITPAPPPPPATSTTLVASPLSISFGQSVTLTAKVAPQTGSGTPTGNVSFVDGTTSIAGGMLNSTGVVMFSTSTLNAGVHSITAVYQGSSNFAASQSAVQAVVVARAPTTTTLTSSASSVPVGQSITFTAAVAPQSGNEAVNGSVRFVEGSTSIGTATLNGSGVATISTASLSVGTHSLVAGYEGTDNFSQSVSASISFQVISGPVVSLSPSALSFASQTVGTASAALAVTITNTGATSLQMTAAPAITGMNAGEFAIDSATSCINGTAIAASGGTCVVDIIFKPIAAGARGPASLQITDNASNSPQTVALTGTANDFALAVAGTQSTLDTIRPGQTATWNLQLSPVDGFSGQVQLGCTTTTPRASCSVNPAFVTGGNTPSPFSVLVPTIGNAILTPDMKRLRPRVSPHVDLVLLAISLVLLLVVFLRWHLAPRSIMSGLLLLAFVVLEGCGGGGGAGVVSPPPSGTTPGTYPVVITGAYNGTSRTIMLSLNVQ